MYAADQLENFQVEHTERKSSITVLEEFFADSGIVKCSKANFPIVVYMLLETIHKQVSLITGKANRFSHVTCRMGPAHYEFHSLHSQPH